jgi:hypothetical protein
MASSSFPLPLSSSFFLFMLPMPLQIFFPSSKKVEKLQNWHFPIEFYLFGSSNFNLATFETKQIST